MVTLTQINAAISQVAIEERRDLNPATAAFLDHNGVVMLVGGTNVSAFSRCRMKVARLLRVQDVYDGNPGERRADGTHTGHYVPSECAPVPE
jgi:hypothetical protein